MPLEESGFQIETMQDDVFEALMSDAPPDTTVNANTLKGGTPPKSDDKEVPDPKKAQDPKNKVQDPVEPTDDSAAPVSTLDDDLKELSETTDDEGNPVSSDDDDTSAQLLKAKAQGLIDQGIWEPFEGMDDFKWTDENYGSLAVTQANWAAEKMFGELVDQSGQYGKAIIEHIKNGGDPNEIIDIFKEAKRIESLDISTEDGQQRIIKDYYKNVLGWSDTKVNKFINTTIDNKGLKEEAEEVKGLLEDEFKAQLEETEKTQKEYLEQQKQAQIQWTGSITKALEGREDIAPKDRKEILNSLTQYNQKLPDGRVVNQFTVDFMKMQADPAKYVDLVLFVKNPDKYLEKIGTKKAKEEAKKTWNFIKNNASIKTNAGTSHQKVKDDSNKNDLIIDWRKISR